MAADSASSRVSAGALTTAAIALTTTATAYASVFCYHCFLSYKRKGEAPIVWSWLPFLGHALELGTDPIALIRTKANEYGEIFGLVLGGKRIFFIADPWSYNVIFKRNPDLSVDEFHDAVLHNFFGVSQKTLHDQVTDTSHLRSGYPKFLFGEVGLSELTLRMQRRVDKIVKHLPQQQEVDLFTFLGRFVFDASVAAVMNDATADDKSLFDSFLAFDKALPLTMANIPLDYLTAAKKSRDNLVSATAIDAADISAFMAFRWEHFNSLIGEKKLTRDEAAKFQLSMMWASVGNTIPAVFWIVYYILQDAAVLARVKNIVMQCSGGELIDVKELDAMLVTASRSFLSPVRSIVFL